LGEVGSQKLRQLLATSGARRMHKRAAVGAQYAEMSHAALDDPAMGTAAGRSPRMS
jgi:hypothetical protein